MPLDAMHDTDPSPASAAFTIPLRAIALPLCLLLLVICCAGSTASPKVPPETLAVGIDEDYPPYEYVSASGKVEGFVVDIVKAVAKASGLSVRFVPGRWDRTMAALKDGRVRMLSGMFYSPLRDRSLDFSAPVLRVSYSAFVRKGDRPVATKEDLRGRTVLVERGTLVDDWLRAPGLGAKVKSVDSDPQAVMKLASGEGAVAVVSYLQGLSMIQESGLTRIEASGPPLCYHDLCFALREGDTLLRSRLDEGLAVLKARGEWRDTYNKWFGAIEPEGVPRELVARYVLLAVLALLLVAAASVAWIWSLRRQVHQRTSELRARLAERRAAEEALRKSEHLLSIAQRTGNVGSWFARSDDLSGIRWSPEVYRIFGVRPDEFDGALSSLQKMIHPEDRERIVRSLIAAVEAESTWKADHRILRPDGTVRWVHVEAAPTKTDDAESQLVGVIQDITERKETEEALLRSQALYQAMARNVPDGAVFIYDRDLRFQIADGEALETVGFTSADVVGKTLAEAFPPEVFGPLTGPYQAALEGIPGMTVVPFGGRVFEIATRPLLSEGGAVLGGLVMAMDVTERRAAEEAARESAESFRAVFQEASVPMILVSAEGRVTNANRSMQALLGYTQSELAGMGIDRIVHPDDWGAHRTQYEELRAGLRSRTPISVQRCLRKSGEVIWGRHMASAVRDAEGRFSLAVGMIQDITEQVALQQQLLQAQKMEAVGRLAGGVAHDFNNLLTGILGYSELLLARMEPDSPLRNSATEIRRASERAASLTRQLLAFSRKQVMELRVLDLNTVVRDVENMLRRLIGEDINLITDLAGSPLAVRADPSQLEQILLNLAVNARDAMPEGGTLTLHTALVAQSPYSGLGDTGEGARLQVLLEVWDTGCGMTEEVLSHIFEPFYTTKEKGKGTGLGLSTVYGVVEQFGGSLSATSSPGEGARFRILLPASEESIAGSAPPQAATATTGVESVLLVEDDDVVRALVRQVLLSRGYQVHEASSGEEALELLESHTGPLDLIVTDVVMPGMTGVELADRAAQAWPGLRILLISGYTQNALLDQRALRPGISFLHKPFSPDVLAARVRKALDEDLTTRSAA
ncbi:MAG TPA: PAS domain S-box protein [Armatimonadota bacterium]|jgi:PAS domain S-box-containing protein